MVKTDNYLDTAQTSHLYL